MPAAMTMLGTTLDSREITRRLLPPSLPALWPGKRLTSLRRPRSRIFLVTKLASQAARASAASTSRV